MICPHCSREIPEPNKVGGMFVSLGVSNADDALKLSRAIELVETAAGDLQFRDDLTEAVKLLREVEAALEVFGGDED